MNRSGYQSIAAYSILMHKHWGDVRFNNWAELPDLRCHFTPFAGVTFGIDLCNVRFAMT